MANTVTSLKPTLGLLLLFFLFAQPLRAITYNFVSSGTWEDASRWNCNCVPPNPLPVGDVVNINAICKVEGASLSLNGTLNVNASLMLNPFPSLGITVNSGGIVNVHNAGVIVVDFGQNLDINAGADVNILNGGNLRVSPAAIISINNLGDLNVNTGSALIIESFAELNVNSGGDLNISGNLNLESICDLRVATSSTVNINGGGKVNVGTSSVVSIFSGGEISVSPGGELNLTLGSGGLNIFPGSFLFNSGTLNIASTVNQAGNLSNSGTFNLNNNGNLILNNNPASIPGGTFNWNSGGKITVSSSGALLIVSGLTVASGRTLEVLSGGLLQHSGGTLSVAGSLINRGTAFINASFNLITGGTLNNSGTANVFANIILNNGSTLNNSGIANINANVNLNAGGNLNNTNNLNLNSGALTLGGTLTNTGALTNKASIFNTSSGIFSNNDGIYKGTGLWSFEFLSPGGTVEPGNSAGCLQFDGTVFLNNTTLAIELGGGTACSQYDRLNITNGDGTATLNTTGGTVRVSFINGFTPSAGQTFEIAVTNLLQGALPNLQMPPGFSGTLSNVGNSFLRLTITSVLPVELLDFRAFIEGEAVQLRWQTASEQNNKGFFVERLTSDGHQWTELGFVAGNGTILQSHTYTFRDDNPLHDLNYYRLRQMDVDGKTVFSNIVQVNFYADEQDNVRVFPNPVSDGQLIVFLPESMEENTTAALYDLSGRFLLVNQLQYGYNSVDMSRFEAGQYLLKIGGLMKKIVVQP
jgi:fibronectin-binding autotransporter adhesin